MNVLVVIDSLGYGGAERLLATLLPELKSQDVVCDVAVLAAPYFLTTELREAGLNVFQLDIKHRWSFFETLWKLQRLIKQGKYDGVWGHLYFGNMYAILSGMLGGVKIKVMTLHSPSHSNNQPFRLWDRFRLKIENQLGGNFANKIVAVSHATAHDYASVFGWKNIEVIHNAIPIKKLPKPISEEDRFQIRNYYRVRKNDFLLVTAARYSVEKGYDIMIDALAQFREKYGWCPRWIAASHGALKHELEEKVIRLNLSEAISLRAALNQSDLFRLIQSADAFVLPSLREPFGIAAGEALALGIPCILSEIDGLCELAGTGDSAVANMVMAGDSNALCDAIWDVYSNPVVRDKKAQAGLLRMKALFDTPGVAEKWGSVFNSGFVGMSD